MESTSLYRIPPAPYKSWAAHRASFTGHGDYNSWLTSSFVSFSQLMRTGHRCGCGAVILQSLLAAPLPVSKPNSTEVIELLSSDDDDGPLTDGGVLAPLLCCASCKNSVCGACGFQYSLSGPCDLSGVSPKMHARTCSLRFVHSLSQQVERVRRVTTGSDPALQRRTESGTAEAARAAAEKAQRQGPKKAMKMPSNLGGYAGLIQGLMEGEICARERVLSGGPN